MPPPADRRLRAWQNEALARYQETSPQDFLVTATPGAGKTTFGLTLATRLLATRKIDRVVVVAPTDHLRTQWADAANDLDIALDPSLTNAVGPVSPDFRGYVTTYAQVAAAPMLHRARIESRKTLVILDEVHHAGDAMSWGDAVTEACDPATRRLCLSGTPYRSDQARIPYVRYDTDAQGGAQSVADYSYGYREALRDGVVRPVMFAAYSGVARWRNSAGEVLAASLSDELSREDETAAWRTAMNPAGQWIAHVIAAADARLTEVRAAGMPDAAGMILATDQENARAYAQVLTRITGHVPVVVTSDDPVASTRLEAFNAGADRWLVSVRMVSEGVDIPRLAVGVYATSSRTPLFFAQAIGRFVRARRRGENATVFLPAVRPLLVLAAELETERNHVLYPPKSDEGLLDELPGETPEPSEPLLGFEALEAQAEFAHVLFGGAAHTGDATGDALDEEAQDFLGLPGLLSPSQTAALLKRREVQHRMSAGKATEVGDPTPAQVQAAHHQAAGLRREINGLVSRVAAKTQTPHAKVHAKIRKAVPGPPSASAPAALLEQRRDYLLTLT